MFEQVMAHAMADELEKLALRKELKRVVRSATDGHRYRLSNADMFRAPVRSLTEAGKMQEHSLGRRAGRLIASGKPMAARKFIEEGKFLRRIRKK